MLNTDANSFDGYALHDYSSGQLAMDALKQMSEIDSSKELVISERSLWGTYGMNRIVQYLRNDAIGYCSWVTMLDSEAKSHQMIPAWVQAFMGNQTDPTLLVQNTSDRNKYRVMPEVYMLGQFSKYIRPGYVRVDSTDTIGTDDFGISNVVFKDPDSGKLIMVVVNNSNEEQTFTAGCGNYQFEATIPATNVATYQWNPNDIDTTAPVIEGKDATVTMGETKDVSEIIQLKVTDNHDGDIDLSKVDIKTDYNPNKAGTYKVIVTAIDQAGNTTEKEFKINVISKESEMEQQNNDKNQTSGKGENIIQTNNTSNEPKTGDNSVSISLMVFICILSLSGIIYFRKKKL